MRSTTETAYTRWVLRVNQRTWSSALLLSYDKIYLLLQDENSLVQLLAQEGGDGIS